MNLRKTIQTVGIVLKAFDNSLNYTKLLKILYFINRQSLNEKGSSIIDDNYVNMPNGIVLSNTYDLIRNKLKDRESQMYWNTFFLVQNMYDLVLRTEILPEGELSRYEKKVINDNIEKYRDYSYSDLIALHHDKNVCPEWENPEGSSKPLSKYDILRALGFSEKEITYIKDDDLMYEEDEKMFAELAE